MEPFSAKQREGWKGSNSHHSALLPAHARQFILGPKVQIARQDWNYLEIRDDLILSYCPELRLRQITDKASRRWVLLGFAVQSDPGRPSPEDELAACSAEDISTIYETWAGRWLLIGEEQLHLDASGLLGCYHRIQQGLWVSSSLALLSRIGGREVPGSRRHRLVKGDGFGWDPPPRCCYEGIAKLLPTQTLDLASGRLLPRNPVPSALASASYEDLVEQTAICLVTTMRNLGAQAKHLWLALSSGYHSRLLLAAALKAGVEFKTYTQCFPLMLLADRDLPVTLSKSVGVEHVMIEPREEVPSLYERMDQHTHGLYRDADRAFYARRQWAWFGPDDIAIRGLGFELGQCFDWPLLPRRPSVNPILSAFGAEHAPSYVKDSVADYLKWQSTHEIDTMDWRDRWYLEMRLGGVVSDYEHALDLLAGMSFVPANSARLYGLLLQFPTEVRRECRHLVDVMDYLWPGLTGYPFNPLDGVFRESARTISKYASIFRGRGAATTFYQVGAALRRRARRVGSHLPGWDHS